MKKPSYVRQAYHEDSDAAWGYGNSVLYRMCFKKPKHNNEGISASKMWLIGRSYAVSPQRKAGRSKCQKANDFFGWLAREIDAPKLDRIISNFDKSNWFSEDSLSLIVKSHEEFCLILEDALNGRNFSEAKVQKGPVWQASFAAKYLHFHRPDHFPIYDSYVSNALKLQFPKERISCSIAQRDKRYERFCRLLKKFVGVNDCFRETLRELDRRLYDIARESKAAHLNASE